jgi:curli biogenesis system outer membrane secretion channel CsgG
MLQTALFESNHFLVMDQSTCKGISAEKLLSESFLSDADAILKQGQTQKGEVSVYGAVTLLEGGGWGLRCKIPGAPVKLGGAYHKAKITIELRVVETESGRVLANRSVKGEALSGKCDVGTTAVDCELPINLKLFANTPLELAIRDCIYRAVINLCKSIPQSHFRHADE